MCKCVIEEICEAPIVNRVDSIGCLWIEKHDPLIVFVCAWHEHFHAFSWFPYHSNLCCNMFSSAEGVFIWKVPCFKLGWNNPIRKLIPEVQLSIFLAEIMVPVVRRSETFPTCFQTKYRTPDAEPKGRKNFITLRGSRRSVRKNLGWLVWQIHSLTKWETHMFTKLEVNYTCWTLLNLYSLVLWLSLYVC